MKYVAFGDIHGCNDELTLLLEKVKNEVSNEATYIFLGDYIDRGPDSSKVIETLIRLSEEKECVFLRGNHEQMALEADLEPYHNRAHWLMNGGLETEKSFEHNMISPEAFKFIRRTQMYFETEKYFFVHAGVHPSLTLEEQDREDFLWIRKTFLNHVGNNAIGKIVVHGHSVESLNKPTITSNRINLDTGCVFGGHLTAAIFNQEDVKIIQHKSKFSWV